MSDALDPGTAIAIIGAAGRYPGARSLREFWENLRAGVESVRRFTDEELLAAGESPAALEDPDYVRAWPVLDDLETFDAAFFGMSPRDAAVMDPQHRFFLEVAWEAMEDAGYDPENTGGPVGVFAACGQNTYMMHHLVTNPEVMETVGEWLVRHTGNDMNFLATRVSYQMNLKGPSMNVQTACSSSLVAVHLACQSLQNGECDMALAGASTMLFPQNRGYLWKQGEIMSKTGHCRPFDAHSDGTIFGSGTGCVVLKRLSDALRDGDLIRGVIRGSAINNDGSLKVGYLAPSVEGQASAIEEAIGISGVAADSISYLEAHGTATAIGDPIEVAALTQAFRSFTDKSQFCAIGSVKANIGHLGEAAGMASLAKVLLAMEHREIPPSINFDRPGPEIDFASSPVFVATKLSPWESRGPRRAGITSLGAGGTNAHVIVEEAPAPDPSGPSRRVQLLVWSAKTAAALDAATIRLRDFLAGSPGISLADVAYTLQTGRKQHAHRRVLVCESTEGAVAALGPPLDPKRVISHQAGRAGASIVFMFPGGGAQYAGAGEELYRTEPAYRAAFDECLTAFDPEIAKSLRRLLLASPPGDEASGAELERPSLSVSAVFAIEYAMAKLLLSWGCEPSAMIGHSMGEYVAACLAEVMTLKEAGALLMLRGRIFERVPPGGMLSVQLPEEGLRPLLGPDLSVAAVNAPSLSVASGPLSAIEALEQALTERDIECTRVHIAVAAHSAMLDSSLAEFERQCRTIRLSPPKIPFMSNLTGTWIKPEEAVDPLYWVRHLRNAVRFSDGVAEVLRGGSRVLLEVGPGRTLSSLARQQPGEAVTALPTLRHPREVVSDVAFLLQTLGRLWMHGVRPAWQAFYSAEKRRRVALPTYPFERNRFWIERGEAQARAAKPKQASQLRKKADVSDWFYVPSWKRSIPRAPSAEKQRYVVFCDEGKLGDRLAARLSPEAVRVTLGYEFVKVSDVEYIVRSNNPVDYVALLEALRATRRFPDQIVHAWSVVGRGVHWSFGLGLPSSGLSRFDKTRERCFDSLLLLARALDEGEEPVTLTVVSDDLFSFGREAVRHPARALLSGPTRVIPREMPQIRTRHVDIGLGGGRREVERALEALAREIESPPGDDAVILYRGGERWVRTHEPSRVEPKPADAPVLRRFGTYVITGGLGGIGLEVAEHFARTAQAKLVLIGRSPVPPTSEWDAWIARHGDGDRTSQRIRKLRNVIALGGEVLPLSADVADREQMAGALSIARERFGQIHGAVHAAGVIDDGLIALKTPEAAAAVIDAKAKGALVLSSLVAKDEPDFLLLFSSVSSILGLEGQIDYTAANAFLDALADEQDGKSKTRVISINWNAWAGVGMAVAIADKAPQQSGPSSVRSGAHPLLGKVGSETKNETRITTSFSRSQHWLLSEHVVRGAEALIPGTGYLEIMRAAFELDREDRAVELSDVYFLSPFAVRVGETRALTVQLNHGGTSSAEVSIFSERHDAPHVTGRIAYVDAPRPRREDLEALAARCSVRVKETGGFLEQQFMDFGPRWGNLRRVSLGDREALVSLELPDPYVDDLASFRLHPALLDMATGGAQAIVPGFDPERDFYVPFSYGKVLLRRGLPQRLWSHVRFTPTGAKDLIGFDVTLYDEEGVEIASITRFMMKRVDLAAVLRSDAARPETPASKVTRIGAVVHQGIQAAEGMDVLDRILAAPVGPRIVASSVDLAEWAAVVDAEAAARAPSADHGPASSAGTAFARPALGTAYVAPRDDVERELAALWRELLGVDKVGIHDDFFELGGQSLIAVRLFNKIRKKYGVDLPISTLFEAPSIASSAAIVRADAGIAFVEESRAEADAHENGALNGAAHPLSPAAPGGVTIVSGTANGHDDSGDAPPESVRSGARKTRWQSLVLMQKKGTELPFYCVAGMGGTLNNLRAVALLMGEKRPVYGLQPPGADGEQKRLYHVEDLAEHYIRQIRTVQPHGPYLLGGYSGGGVAAFEMTRQLEAQGEKVLFLGFLDTFSPHLPLRPLVDRMKIHLRRVKNYGPAYLVDTGYRRLYSEARTLQMKGRRQLGRIFAEKYRYEALQDSWVVAESRYRPGTWDGKAVLFRAREESAVSRWTAVEVDEQHGWGRYVKGGVEVVICPGDHQTMCEEPYVRTLAQKLREAIERATAAEEGTVPPSPVTARSTRTPHAPASSR